ncbi:MAG: hypothetical protein DSY37_01105 [Hyperthermus sp.]|nr:MAG: hypothetical protein DSY37_01105 [Hyperthermus sp.]
MAEAENMLNILVDKALVNIPFSLLLKHKPPYINNYSVSIKPCSTIIILQAHRHINHSGHAMNSQ